jgi:1-acyl-sn-glycerol-3-phosphate acyltransferase
VSHLDPFCLGALWPRPVSWMARVEFYRRGWSARAMRWLHAFPVHRQGVPVSAIREALRRLAAGEVVGLFPEGEIMSGRASVLRGGRIKRGVCLLAARSGRPVLPCLVLGTEQLNRVEPWLPAWRGRLWVAVGDCIPPVIGPDRRAARAQMAAELERAFVQLYAQARAHWQLPDSILP